METRFVKEEEEKYILSLVNKQNLWDRELIIYQWFNEDIKDNLIESKLKIIFDICNISIKVVNVEKRRINETTSKKKIDYLSLEDIDFQDLLNKPFVLKRRSIKGNMFLDYFLRSNNTCEYLLEIENPNSSEEIESSELEVIRCVTKDKSYFNKNMTVKFLEEDLIGLKLLIECFKK